jgi:hypothetical protein
LKDIEGGGKLILKWTSGRYVAKMGCLWTWLTIMFSGKL